MTDKTEEELKLLAKDLIDKDIIPNLNAWKAKDKQWMTKRKEQWPEIEKRLLYTGMKKSQTIKCKKYYLTGKLPIFNGEAQIPMIYLVWLHPDKSYENWDLIRKVIQSLGSYLNYAVAHFRESDRQIWHAGYGSGYGRNEGFDSGLFMGDEEKLWQFMYGEDDGTEKIKFDGVMNQEKQSCHRSVFLNALGMIGWVSRPAEKDAGANLTTLKQTDAYLEYWYNSLTDKNLTELFTPYKEGSMSENTTKEEFIQYLTSLASFDADTYPDKPKSLYAKKVRKILNERPLESIVKELWKSARAEAKAVNH